VAPPEVIFWSEAVFLVGILIASLDPGLWINILVIFIALVWISRKIGLPKAIFFIFVFLFAIFFFNLRLTAERKSERIIYGRPVVFPAVVEGDPTFKDESQFLPARLLPPFQGDITILTSALNEFSYGDLVEINGMIEPGRKPREKALTAFPDIRFIASDQGAPLITALSGLKTNVTGVFKRTLPPDQAALLAGITLGARSGMSSTLKEKMLRSGTTHIVAISGYNISVLVVAVFGTLKFFFRRRTNFIFTVIIIVLFGLMVGGEASVVRAAIMGIIVLLSRELGKLHDPKYVVLLAATIMVVADPTLLVFDRGFELSFLSFLGIVYLAPFLRERFRMKDGGFLNWKENALMTFSAQLMVVPLLLLNFGRFSLTSFLANVLILESVPVVMMLGFALGVLGIWSAVLAAFLGLAAYVLLSYELLVINVFSILRLEIPGQYAGYAGYATLFGLILFFVLKYKNEALRK